MSEQQAFSQGRQRPQPYVSYALIGINVLVLAVLIVVGKANPLLPDSMLMLEWGGNNRFAVMQQGEWWRLITHMFQHYGIIHLGMNMYILFQIGPMLELNFGRWRLLLFYLLSGITGGMASIWFHDGAVGAGASGAIFGLFGAMGALATTNLIRKEYRMGILKNLGYFIVINIAIGFQSGMIDNAAHIGGLVGGILAAYGSYFALHHPNRAGAKVSGILLPLLLNGALCVSLFLFTGPARDPRTFSSIENKIQALETEVKTLSEKFAGRELNGDDTAGLKVLIGKTDTLIQLTGSLLTAELDDAALADLRLYLAIRKEEQSRNHCVLELLRNDSASACSEADIARISARIDSLGNALQQLRKNSSQ